MDSFFTQEYCDRCGSSLQGGRTMSMFNTDCICMACELRERQDPRYKEAQEADRAQIIAGNYNFKGIGW